jgi:ABC-type transport system substrate-binding protein
VSVIPDQQAVNAAFRSGRLDSGGVDELNLESAQRAHPDLNIYQTLLLTRELFLLNLNRAPLGDERVRLDVHRAIDRDQIVNTIWNGNGVATGPVSPVLTAWALPEGEFRSLPGYLRMAACACWSTASR